MEARAAVSPQEHSARAYRWLAKLPAAVRPIKLGEHFPRIVNQLAEAAGRSAVALRVALLQLVIDTRAPKRHGFPPEIQAELQRLVEHYALTAAVRDMGRNRTHEAAGPSASRRAQAQAAGRAEARAALAAMAGGNASPHEVDAWIERWLARRPVEATPASAAPRQAAPVRTDRFARATCRGSPALRSA